MAIKVLIKRKIKQGQLRAAGQLLLNARYKAMEQSGYISSETLSDTDDAHKIVVVSMWQDLASWQGWKTSDSRQTNEARFEPLLDGPTQYETYNLGMQTV